MEVPFPPPGSERLTLWTQAGGCACKIGPKVLEEILRSLPLPRDPRLIVGPELRDDAAVFALSPDRALVLTTDFFPPLVDDPELFGEIASANALSDIYAMGGTPLVALYLVGFPLSRGAPLALLPRILEGARRILEESNCLGVGGHTLDTPEPLFGLAVVGEIDPRKVWRNSAARAGDRLFLTKPLGTGILASAFKKGRIGLEGYAPAIESMRTLNRTPWEILRGFEEGGIHAVTDVTGFGLLGHLTEILIGSSLSAELDLGAIPTFPEVLPLAREGILPQGLRRNREYVNPYLDSPPEEDPRFLLTLDPQTNGGFLFTAPQELSPLLKERFRTRGAPIWEIGSLFASGKPSIRFLR